MKLRTFLLSAWPLLLVALLFFSCQKRLQENISSSDSSLTVMDAKQFFKNNILTKKTAGNGRHGFSRRYLSKKNRWPKAFIKQLSIGKAVVVPLKFHKELYMYRGKGRIHLPISDLSWMLFYRDSLHKIHEEVVTYLPDNTYFKDTAKNKKFTGIVTVSDWNGKFIKGFKYDSNGIEKVIHQEDIKVNSSSNNRMAEERSLLCTATDWYTEMAQFSRTQNYTKLEYNYGWKSGQKKSAKI